MKDVAPASSSEAESETLQEPGPVTTAGETIEETLPETLEPSASPPQAEAAGVGSDDAARVGEAELAEDDTAGQPEASAESGADVAEEPTVGDGELGAAASTSGEEAAGDMEALAQTAETDAEAEGADADAAVPSPEEAIAPAVAAVGRRAVAAQAHTPTEAAAGSAQMAAVEPSVQQRRGAAVGSVGQLDEAEPADVDRVSFKQQLMNALKAAVPTPQTEDEAERLMNQGAANASSQLQAQVGAHTSAAAGEVATATSQENQVLPESVEAAPAVPLSPESVGEAPAPVSPDSVVPDPLAPERVDYSANSTGADTLMAENEITNEQLAGGGEPNFDAVLGARSEAETNNVEGPAAFRQSEEAARQESRARAAQSLGAGIGEIHGTRAERITAVASQQSTTQSTDSAERLRITAEIERIKTATRDAVQQILTEMEIGATSAFESGLTEAEEAYEEVFEDEKGGFFSWLGGSLTGSWDETVERAFRVARRAYEEVVNRTIDAVATFVEQKLAQAKARVAEGKLEVDGFVAGLDSSVAAFGEEAKSAIGGDFDAMVGDIDGRRDGLVSSLAQQYGESQRRVSAMEERLREENKSLWDAVYDATIGVVQKIIEFKNMLLGLLAKAAAVVGAIIDDPIGFLGNLITGLKAGLDAFVGNIGEHLKDGLMGWLFGALQGAGLTLPTTFDLKGILDLVFQVLGLTKENIRKRAVRLLGESLVSRLEQVADVFMVLATEGPVGLWRMIVEKLGDIKTMILGQIEDFVVTEIVKAGVKWLLGLLNPAAAFIKACMMIYDIVKFFIERGSQIIALVDSIIGALGAIVGGNIKAMADAVEGALARILPVAISFLASLLGLGGISDKIREIIAKLQKPVMAAIDWVIQKAVALFKGVGRAIGLGGPSQEESQDGSDTEPVGGLDGDVLKTVRELAADGAPVDDLEQIADAIATRHGPAGLQSVSFEPSDEVGYVDVLIEASPLRRVTHFRVSDLQLSFPRTALTVEVIHNRRKENLGKWIVGRRKESEGTSHHAEQRMIRQLLESYFTGDRETQGSYHLIISITRSPCDVCGPALEAFVDSVRGRGFDIRMTVRMLSAYGGDSPETIEVLSSLRSKGIKLKALTPAAIEREVLMVDNPGRELSDVEEDSLRSTSGLVSKLLRKISRRAR